MKMRLLELVLFYLYVKACVLVNWATFSPINECLCNMPVLPYSKLFSSMSFQFSNIYLISQVLHTNIKVITEA